MKQRYSNKTTVQKGFVFPLALSLILIMLIFGGLAFDSSRNYMTKLRIQKAVDAASVTGSNLIGTSNASKALDVADAFASASLRAMGYNPDNIATNVSWTPGTSQTELSVAASVDNKNLILGMIPNMPDISNIKASGKSATTKSVTCLVLDTSGSMDRNAGSAVVDPDNIYSPAEKSKKITHLKEATKAFIDMFDEGEDYIAIVRFSLTASVVLPFTTNFKAPSVRDLIQSIETVSYTNTEHGIRLCADQFANLDPDIRNAAISNVVLISDGAPTVSCKNENVYAGNAFLSGTVDASCDLDSTGGNGRQRETHFTRAIHASDGTRELGGSPITFYTVGIGHYRGSGTMTAEELEAFDAYQDVFSGGSILKSNFLMRVALHTPKVYPDLSYPTDTKFPVNYFKEGVTLPAPPRFEDYRTEHSIMPTGQAFLTSDPSQLTEILRRIGNKIKGRLVG